MSFARLVVAGALVLALAPHAAAQSDTTNTTSTVTFATVNTTIDTPVSQQVDTYSLQLIARMLGGPVLFDQLFSVPFGDAGFQAAIAAAQSVLASSGATAVQGPTLQSSGTSLVSSVPQTVVNDIVTSFIVGLRTQIGPGIMTVGDLGVCQSYTLQSQQAGDVTNTYPAFSGCTLDGEPFIVAPGTTNFDFSSVTLNETRTTTTTTNTYLTTQVYELVGLTSGGGQGPGGQDPPTSSVPEPASLAAAGVGLAAALAFRRRDARRR